MACLSIDDRAIPKADAGYRLVHSVVCRDVMSGVEGIASKRQIAICSEFSIASSTWMSTSLYFRIDQADEQEPRVPVSIEPDFSVMPADWPGMGHEGPLPSDMSHFVPQGLAMSAPRIVTPYLGAPEPAYYGAGNTITHPVKSAPLNDDAGGVFYFSQHMTPTTLVAAFNLFGFRSLETEYALFLATSKQPHEDNFLDTIRIVSLPALRHFYRCDTSALTTQARNAGEAVRRFLE
ncbi:MAG: hypothetical protein AB7O57_10580 [Hyphomicrobiaceae bacterium]